MSMNEQVREFFRAHPGVKFDNAQLREKLDTDDAQAISVALNVMHNNGELKREARSAGNGFRYWTGTAAPDLVRTVKGRDTTDDDEVGTKPARVKKPKAAKKAKAAKPPKEKKTKRKYKKRTPPQAPAPATDPDPPANGSPGSAVFAIRQDGELGIDNGGKVVALPKSEVQRMQAFLKTVSPLWN